MFIVMMRSRGVNAPLQPPQTGAHQVYTSREEAEKHATYIASAFTGTDYFVFEAMSQHSARIEVDVKKP
jgi:hypothetical protein